MVAAASKESKILVHVALLTQDFLCLAPGQVSAASCMFDSWGERLCCSGCLTTEGIDGHSCKITLSKAAQAPFFRAWDETSRLFFTFHHIHSQKYQKVLRDFTYSKLQSSFNLSASSKNLMQCHLDLRCQAKAWA